MQALDPDVEIAEFDVRRNWLDRPDVVHVHWPERASEPEGIIAASVKSGLMILHLLAWRLRRVPLVWTVHNLQSHEQRHPRLERMVKHQVVSACRGSIHLSKQGRDVALETYPPLQNWPSPVIPLPALVVSVGDDAPIEEVAERAEGEIAGRAIQLVSFGRIRAYKNTPQLVSAFADLGSDHPIHLTVADRPDDPGISEALEAHSGNPRITLDLRWFKDEEMIRIVHDADVAVLPYRSFFNSGAVVDALAFGVPAAVTRSAATEELAATVGDAWLRLLPHELTSEVVAGIIEWAAQPRPPRPNLADHGLEVVAQRTLDLLKLVSRR